LMIFSFAKAWNEIPQLFENNNSWTPENADTLPCSLQPLHEYFFNEEA
jgi:hypothetical protein